MVAAAVARPVIGARPREWTRAAWKRKDDGVVTVGSAVRMERDRMTNELTNEGQSLLGRMGKELVERPPCGGYMVKRARTKSNGSRRVWWLRRLRGSCGGMSAVAVSSARSTGAAFASIPRNFRMLSTRWSPRREPVSERRYAAASSGV